jgi:hypothetical protein
MGLDTDGGLRHADPDGPDLRHYLGIRGFIAALKSGHAKIQKRPLTLRGSKGASIRKSRNAMKQAAN